MGVPAQHQTDKRKAPGVIIFGVPYTGSAYKPAIAPVSAQEKTLVASIDEYKESEAYRQGFEAGKQAMAELAQQSQELGMGYE